MYSKNALTMVVDLLSSQIEYSEQTQRYCVGVTAIVKVTLRDGVYHEDVGFGMLDNCRQKGKGTRFSNGTASISPPDNNLCDPVQERSRDRRVEAHTP